MRSVETLREGTHPAVVAFPDPTYSISELNGFIQAILRERIPRPIWVRGEIKGYDLRKHRQWVSFKLVEKRDEADDVVAEVAAILAPDDRRTIEAVLKRAENAFELQDGIEARFRVEVDLWVKAGLYQLRIRGIDPTYTLGRLAQHRKRIIEQLTQRNLIDRNKALPMPLVPLRIGLIAAKGSAGYTDFITHLSQSGVAFVIRLADAAMQGPQVESEVSGALRAFNRDGTVDVIVITRGGGGATDLSWFDRFGLAEAIATSQIPVLTGLGHAHDTSVADLVAYANLKTPTDAAQYLIARVTVFLDELDDAAGRLAERVDTLFQLHHDELGDAGQQLVDAARSFVASTELWLVDCQRDITRQGQGLVSMGRQFLQNCQQRMGIERMRQFIDREDDLVGEQGRRLRERITWLLQHEGEDLRRQRRSYGYPRISRTVLRAQLGLQAAEARVAMLDPIKTLRRGFSITRAANGRVVSSISQAAIDEPLTTSVGDGTIQSRVERIESLDEASHG